MNNPRKKLKYSSEEMERALQDVKKGMAIAAAAKKHGVPRATLQDKIKGRTPETRRMGPVPCLTKANEDVLVNWIENLSKIGFPVTTAQVLNSVKRLVEDLQIQNPFTDGRPGRSWMQGFMKRNPSISKRVAQNLTISRASVTAEQLENWANKIFSYLQNNGQEHILNDATRVFNGDESAFFLNPKAGKVLAPKGDKTVYQQVNSDEKECITVLVTASAAGVIAPPLLVFKYTRIPSDIANSVPPDWGIGRSDSGWMTSALFYEYIANVFYPWLVKKEIELPVILFVDGHTSHMTLQTSEFCDKHGIILIALYPNATHLIQPMDVAVFRSLKGKWQKKVHEWRLENIHNPVLKRRDFCPLFKEVLNDVAPSVFQNGFKACGLVPWNPKAVKIHLKDCAQNTIVEKLNTQDTKAKQALEVLEDIIGVDKLQLFRCSDQWEGCREDASLFEVWKEMQNRTRNRENRDVSLSEKDSEAEQFPRTEAEVHTSINISEPQPMSPVAPEPSTSRQALISTPQTPENTDKTYRVPSPQPSTSRQALIPTPQTPENSEKRYKVPSPFKKALFFPNTLPRKTKRGKETIPSVVTSQSWQDYHKRKEEKKLKPRKAEKEN